jgi:uncharacterized protein (DUF433 family)/CRISPR/Cas system CSM-associated protein Csm2 small subunit
MTNTITKIQPRLGEGIFLLRDVAEILNIPTPKVTRWLDEYWTKRFGIEGFGGKRERGINFHALVEFIVFAKLREHNFSVQRISKIHEELAKEFKTAFPFAFIELFVDKQRDKQNKKGANNVWHNEYGSPTKTDGKKQLGLKEILEPTLLKIDFDNNRVAFRYFPLGKEHKIVVDPKFQFGKPIILGTSIKAEIIYDMIIEGVSKKSISNLYNITQEQIDDVILYFNNRNKKVAA